MVEVVISEIECVARAFKFFKHSAIQLVLVRSVAGGNHRTAPVEKVNSRNVAHSESYYGNLFAYHCIFKCFYARIEHKHRSLSDYIVFYLLI